jgi:hypothetical protein
MNNPTRKYAPWLLVLIVGAAFFLGLTWCMSVLWDFDFFVFGGDVHTYWEESLAWGTLANPHHPPGYPLLIAFVRALSAGILSPLALMQFLTFTFLMGGAFQCAILCRREGVRRGWMASLLYLAWPFVGILYAVYPQKDSVVLFLLILGIVLGLDGRWIWTGVAWGIATWMHPLAWIFVPILIPIPWMVFFQERSYRPDSPASARMSELRAMTAAAVLPLIAFWVWKTAATGDPLSIITSIAGAQVVSRGSWPVLDGWIGTVMDGGIAGWIKVGILGLVVLLAACLLLVAIWDRTTPSNGQDRYRRIVSAAIPAGILGMAILLNQHEIWAVVRFSKILILPAILLRDSLFGFVPQCLRWPALWALIVAGFLSQIAYAWYMSTVFFGA